MHKEAKIAEIYALAAQSIALPMLDNSPAVTTFQLQFERYFETRAVGTKCTISVVFKPTVKRSLTATLNVNAGGGAGTQTVALSGTGR